LLRIPIAPALFRFVFALIQSRIISIQEPAVLSFRQLSALQSGGLFSITLFWNRVRVFLKRLFSTGEGTKEIRNKIQIPLLYTTIF